MSDDNVGMYKDNAHDALQDVKDTANILEYLMINYDDQLDSVVDSVNYLLQDYGLVFEEDDNKNSESHENGDGRMWWTIKELKNE